MKTFDFQLAAVDLDGTLLGPDGKVGARNRAAIDMLRSAAVTVVIASGRMHAATVPTYEELGLDTPIVSYNGALVMSPASGETLLDTPLDAEIAATVVRWAEAENLHLNYYIHDTLYVEKADHWSDLYHQRTGSIIHPVGSLRQFDGQTPTKVLFVGEPEETLRYRDQWQATLADRCYIVRTAVEYLEFLNPAANKWAGVQAVARRFRIPDSQVAAFGDSLNDTPMIRGAAVGVVMPYAQADLLALADFVAGGAPEDAFACAVEGLAQR